MEVTWLLILGSGLCWTEAADFDLYFGVVPLTDAHDKLYMFYLGSNATDSGLREGLITFSNSVCSTLLLGTDWLSILRKLAIRSYSRLT